MGLTEKRIRDAKADGKARTIWDDDVVGLGLQVTPKGKKNFIIRYRVGRQKKQAILCRASNVNLKDVRKQAATELLAIRSGDSRGPLDKRHQELTAPTFADLWQRFAEDHAPERIQLGRMTPRTLKDYSIIARDHILTVLGKFQVEAITKADIERLLKKMQETPVRRNRTLALANHLFTLAETWGLRPQHSNPCRGIPKAKEVARDRVLSSTELQALNAALLTLEDKHPFEVRAIYLATLTGLRISEAVGLQWQHVDLENGRAILPKTKTGKRVLPLAVPVQDLLKALPRYADNPFCFPASRGEVACTYKQTRFVFGLACHRAGIAGAQLHDLRRTVATRLAAHGLNAFTLRDVLGHGSVAMSNRYVRIASDSLRNATEQAAALMKI